MHSQLDVEPRIYAKPFPKFGKPSVIGYIGLENLKFAKEVKEKSVHFDLNLHIDKSKKKKDGLDVKLTDLLNFLLESEHRLRLPIEKSLDAAPFFCYRGLLTCLACTPYENNEPWKIVAILFKGKIYLCARNTEEKIRRTQNMSEWEKLCSSWGFKFEQFLLSGIHNFIPMYYICLNVVLMYIILLN